MWPEARGVTLLVGDLLLRRGGSPGPGGVPAPTRAAQLTHRMSVGSASCSWYRLRSQQSRGRQHASVCTPFCTPFGVVRGCSPLCKFLVLNGKRTGTDASGDAADVLQTRGHRFESCCSHPQPLEAQTKSGSSPKAASSFLICPSFGRWVNPSAASSTFGRMRMSPTVLRKIPSRPSTQPIAVSMAS